MQGAISHCQPTQLYRAQNRPYEYYQTLGQRVHLISNITLADTYEYAISINNTTTCEVTSETFEIIEANNQQLDVDLDVIDLVVEMMKVVSLQLVMRCYR